MSQSEVSQEQASGGFVEQLAGGWQQGLGFWEKLVARYFSKAGITYNGLQPWDMQVHDKRMARRVALKGSLGLGESYAEGMWDCERLDEMFCRYLSSHLHQPAFSCCADALANIRGVITNCQSRRRAFIVGERHYDVGNDLYEAMLDGRMVYTCAYWKDATTVDEAQEAKLDLVCRKIGLKAGEKVLDVGCGWGSFAKFAAERYGAEVTGITISKEQLRLARERCEGLPVTLELCDYRAFSGEFDHVVSLGMMEHVGFHNYRTYAQMLHRCLKPGGLALIQVIGTPHSMHATDPWLDRYIFPNSMLPSVSQIGKAIDGLLNLEDWHAFGMYYDRTLMAWNENFENAWDDLKHKYDEYFHRMWRYYLLMCAGIFRARQADLWQIVLSKGRPGGCYAAVR